MEELLRGTPPVRPGAPLRRVALVASLAALWLATSAGPASGAVTIGQLGTPSITCNSGLDWMQPSVTSGNAYVVPADGRITSWSTNANASSGNLALKVFRHVSESTYEAVGHDGPRALTPSTLNTFGGLSIPVSPGDVLGVHPASNSLGCFFDAAGDSGMFFRAGDLADGESGDFTPFAVEVRLNVTAVVEPTNAFTLGKAKLNKRKGIAKLPADVPNAGKLVLSGKGLKKQTKTVDGAGKTKLIVKPKGRLRTMLEEKGRAKARAKVRYTPRGGDSRTRSRKVTLRKR